MLLYLVMEWWNGVLQNNSEGYVGNNLAYVYIPICYIFFRNKLYFINFKCVIYLDNVLDI